MGVCGAGLPAVCYSHMGRPHTTIALGISPLFVINMLHWLAQSQSIFNYRWQLADVAEMNPTYDIDNRTAKLAARLIFEMVNAKFA